MIVHWGVWLALGFGLFIGILVALPWIRTWETPPPEPDDGVDDDTKREILKRFR